MKSAKLTITKMDSEDGCKAFAQSSVNGLTLKVGDVVVSACVDGVECGTRVFQAVTIKDPEDGRRTLHSASGVDLAGAFIEQEILSVLEQK